MQTAARASGQSLPSEKMDISSPAAAAMVFPYNNFADALQLKMVRLTFHTTMNIILLECTSNFLHRNDWCKFEYRHIPMPSQ
jgi:hypothetical protein